MKLNNFTLTINDEIVRAFEFHDGLNIITDEKDYDGSGNSVGKSTLGRVIDYLFDGSIKDIYIDKDTDTPNQEIRCLFENKKVTASLNYKGLDGKDYTLTRKLSNENKNSYYIDNAKVSKKKYQTHILKNIFATNSKKPSLRKLAPKIFRTNNYRMLHNLKLLDEFNKVSREEYNTFFLYYFGFTNTALLSERHILNLKIRNASNRSRSLGGLIKDEKVIGLIKSLKNQIQALEKELLVTDEKVNKLEIVQDINAIDDSENAEFSKLFNLESKIKNIHHTNEILTEESKVYLLTELERVYEYVGANIDTEIADYTAAIDFHNELVTEKLNYISQDLPGLVNKKKAVLNQIELLQTQKMQMLRKLRSKEGMEHLSDTVKKIGELSQELVRSEALVHAQEKLDNDLVEYGQELEELSKKFNAELRNLNLFEQKFSENFKSLTEALYGEEYNFSLNLDSDSFICNPVIDDLQSNNEGGLKRLEVVAFDLAYIKTVSDLESHRPSFVFHDSIDDIDMRLVAKLFKESQSAKGQHIVAMLSEKLSKAEYKSLKPHMVLELSQNNKFFKV